MLFLYCVAYDWHVFWAALRFVIVDYELLFLLSWRYSLLMCSCYSLISLYRSSFTASSLAAVVALQLKISIELFAFLIIALLSFFVLVSVALFCSCIIYCCSILFLSVVALLQMFAILRVMLFIVALILMFAI